MTSARRYDEAEVAEILRRAAETESAPAIPSTAAPSGPDRGLTLAQIQEIAGEVGIDPAVIQHAAFSLEVVPESVAPPARFLGAPRSVSRTVALPRDLTDDEWMRLVAVLRETFGTRGIVEQVGSLRTWYHGNLQVHVEPAEDGHRVRMYTFKGNTRELTILGGAFLFMAILTGLLIFAKKGVDPGLIMSAVFGAVGLGAIGTARLALPRWAETRAEQMESIAEQLPRLMGD